MRPNLVTGFLDLYPRSSEMEFALKKPSLTKTFLSPRQDLKNSICEFMLARVYTKSEVKFWQVNFVREREIFKLKNAINGKEQDNCCVMRYVGGNASFFWKWEFWKKKTWEWRYDRRAWRWDKLINYITRSERKLEHFGIWEGGPHSWNTLRSWYIILMNIWNRNERVWNYSQILFITFNHFWISNYIESIYTRSVYSLNR